VKAGLASFGAGLLFAAGLVVSGMGLPAKVIGFLDVLGDWDPSLAFVMGGALAVYLPLYRVIVRQKPLFAAAHSLPTKKAIDAPLVAGAALFGVGWGLVGYCPGPSLVAAGALVPAALVFVPAMLAGMLGGRLLGASRGRAATATAPTDG
jgi:uncharacterized membrane protein YedE/YeeE